MGTLLTQHPVNFHRFAGFPGEGPPIRHASGAEHTLTVAAVLLITAILAVLVPIAPESAGDALATLALHQALAAAGWGKPEQWSLTGFASPSLKAAGLRNSSCFPGIAREWSVLTI